MVRTPVATPVATFDGSRSLLRIVKRFSLGMLLVGDTGFEPVTSSVSGKRAPTAPIARGGDGI